MTASQALLTRYKEVVTPAIYRYTDLTFAWGEGVYLYDVDGRRYLDFSAGIATMAVGHQHPRVVEAVVQQARRLFHAAAHIGVMEPYVALLEKVRSLAPGRLKEGKGILVNSGSEAVEAALKLARYVTGRPIVIAFRHAFHGRPMGALAATASNPAFRRRLSGLTVGVHHMIYPTPRVPFGSSPEERGQIALALIEEALRTVLPPEDVAGILVEPILGEGGYFVPPPGFLEGLRAICDRYGFLLIVDEVQTGLGRTGRWFAVEHWGVEPDILILGKALGGGLPLGAVLVRRELADAWDPGAHGSTFGGNPLACQAGLATIAVIEEENLLENARQIGAYLRERFEEAQTSIPMIGDVRGLGLMLGVELVEPKTWRPASARIGEIVKAISRSGVVITKCGESTLRIAPPLILTRDQADEGVEIILGILREWPMA